MDFNQTEINKLSQILQAAADQEVMTRFNQLASGEIRTKGGPFDLVTAADIACENYITDAISKRFPEALVIGEEAVSQGRSTLNTFEKAPLAIVIDPVDGTRNFAVGTPLFGTIAAVIREGEIIAGVIVDPLLRRRYYALRGQGAWREDSHGVHRLQVASEKKRTIDMEISVSTGHLPPSLRDQVNGRLSRFGSVNMFHCAAQDYRLIVEGATDGLFFYQLYPWDHAAGWLLHQEAGGYSAHFDGRPYCLSAIHAGLICATDEASWHLIHQALLDQVPYE